MGNDEEFCGPKRGQAMGVVGSSHDEQWGDEQGRNLTLCNSHSTQKLYRKGVQPGVLGKDTLAGAPCSIALPRPAEADERFLSDPLCARTDGNEPAQSKGTDWRFLVFRHRLGASRALQRVCAEHYGLELCRQQCSFRKPGKAQLTYRVPRKCSCICWNCKEINGFVL